MSNNGLDTGSEFISRDEFEMHFEHSQEHLSENKKSIVGLIAPAGMYYVIQDYGLEVGIKLITTISRLMKKMCSDKLKATIWTQKSIVFMIEDLSEVMVIESLNKIRMEYLERFGDSYKLNRTPGLRAVLTNLSADKGLHETIDKLSSQLFQLSKMKDTEPIQFYGSSVSLRRRVMIADPDPIAMNVITHRLKKDGYDPVVFQETSELLRDLDAGNIAGILIDSMVPEGGVNMIKTIHAQPDMAKIPIMLFSRYGFEDEIASAFEAGAQDYMMKPLSMVELSARMKRLTG
jgi:CheY-like chemotaxis protein